MHLDDTKTVCTSFSDAHAPADDTSDLLDVLQLVVARCDSHEYGVVTTSSLLPRRFSVFLNSPFSWGDEPRSCLLPSLVEVVSTPKELRCCRMLLRHGVTENFCDIFEAVNFYRVPTMFGPDICGNMLADFCSGSFVRLMILAGVDFSGRQDVLVWIQDVSCFEAYLSMLDEEFKRPRSLQEYCVMTVRRTLAGGQLWSKIDLLPLPKLLKDTLKLTSL